jgi:FtsH-binding integral membrane protein
MYRTVVIDVWIAVFAVIAADALCRAVIGRRKRSVSTRHSPMTVLRSARIIINISGLVCFGAVAGTGFLTVLAGHETLTGYRLLAHVIAATAFVMACLLVTLFWTHRNQFRSAASSDFPSTSAVLLRKVFFWVALALLLPTILSIIGAMFPLPTPDQQELLFRIHRSCALPMAAASLLFVYFAAVSWRERTES